MDPSSILDQFPAAQPWSLWVGQIGKALIFSGIGFFLIVCVTSFLQGKKPALAKINSVAFLLGTFALLGAMACLITLFVRGQFQYEYVFGHSDVHTPLKYRIAGVWAGQQGSFLLWACGSAIFGALSLWGAGEYRRWFTLTFAVFLGSLCGILAYETPFNIIPEAIQNGVVKVPITGRGLVASLQDYWFTIHPPTIFLGFGALTIPFAYSIAAMISKDLRTWVFLVRPWVMVALALVGTGLIMGGLWAYETLGWGGFWKWDPVENTSFVPWIMLAALVHGIIVQTTRGRWHGPNLILAALPFLSFAYGTFLTRSGFLTDVSVHSFAEMNKSALVILEVLIGVAVLAFSGIYAVRGRRLAKIADRPAVANGFNRETAYVYGTLLLSLLALVIAVGMSWPFILTKVLQRKAAVVEEGLYHNVVVWFFIPIMLLMAIAPFLSWRNLPLKQQLGRIVNVFSLSAGLAGFAMFAINNPNFGVPMPRDPFVNTPFGKMGVMPLMGILLFLCTFVAVSSLWRVVELRKQSKMSLGGFVAHLGVATIVGGLILSRGLESHDEAFFRPNETPSLLGYTLKYKGFSDDPLLSHDNKVLFEVTAPNGDKFEARPGLYFFRDEQQQQKAMVWPHVQHFATHDVYLALSEPIIFAWKQPVWFKEGETKTIDGVTVKYQGLHMQGTPGQPGTAFGAKLKITTDDGRTYDAEPKMVIGGEPVMPQFSDDFCIAINQMEAADKSVALQLLFSPPVYHADLYYKPLTGLIWLGAGILFLGGMMTAYARRVPKTLPVLEAPEADAPGSAVKKTENAPVPAT